MQVSIPENENAMAFKQKIIDALVKKSVIDEKEVTKLNNELY